VWDTGCNSWYLTDEGSVELWPYDRETMTAMLSRPDNMISTSLGPLQPPSVLRHKFDD